MTRIPTYAFALIIATATVALIAIGLWRGARDETLAARVYVAPANAAGDLNVQARVVRTKSGISDVAPSRRITWLSRNATKPGAHETDAFGLASWTIPAGAVGTLGDFTLVDADSGRELAGATSPPPTGGGYRAPREAPLAWRPPGQEGELELELVARANRLLAGQPTRVWVHALDREGHAIVDAKLVLRPDPGLSVRRANAPELADCASGWQAYDFTPTGLATGLALDAQGPEGSRVHAYMGVPGTGGGARVDAPVLARGERVRVRVQPSPGVARLYLELHDGDGIRQSVSLDGLREGKWSEVEIGPLRPGWSWLLVSSSPPGVGSFEDVTAFPIRAGSENACEAIGELRTVALWPHERQIWIDGVEQLEGRNEARRAHGRSIALYAATGGALASIALMARRGRRRIKRSGDGDEADTERSQIVFDPLTLVAFLLGLGVLAFAIVLLLVWTLA